MLIPRRLDPACFKGLFRDAIRVGETWYIYEELYYAPGTHPLGVQWENVVRTSPDGTNWSPYGGSLTPPGADGSFDRRGQADPTVVYVGPGDWRMLFDALDENNKWRGFGLATSEDGITWVKRTDPVMEWGPAGAWDSGYIHHPCMMQDGDGLFHVFYAGSMTGGGGYAIGHATSEDCITWVKDAAPVIQCGTQTGDPDMTRVRPCSPIYYDGRWWMYYWGYTAAEAMSRTCLAVSDDLSAWAKLGVAYEPTGEPYGKKAGVERGSQAAAITTDLDGNHVMYLVHNTGSAYYTHRVEMDPTAFHDTSRTLLVPMIDWDTERFISGSFAEFDTRRVVLDRAFVVHDLARDLWAPPPPDQVGPFRIEVDPSYYKVVVKDV